MQIIQTKITVALAPLADGHPRQAHSPGDCVVGFTSPAGQYGLGGLHYRMRQGSGMGKALHTLSLVIAEDQRRYRASKRHRAPWLTLPILAVISGETHSTFCKKYAIKLTCSSLVLLRTPYPLCSKFSYQDLFWFQLPSNRRLTAPVHSPERVTVPTELNHSEGDTKNRHQSSNFFRLNL